MKKILETPRLYLRSLIPEDLDSVAKMFADIDVMRYVGTGIVLSKDAAKKSIAKWNQYEEKFGFANWAVVRKEDDMMIGECGFNWLPDNSDIEISYMFDKPFWGKGYATEAASETLKYGANSLCLRRIAAMVYPGNTASIKILEKIGMKYVKNVEFWEKTLRFYLFQ